MSARHILIINDVRIDGDTLGSSLAMHLELLKRGKEVEHISPKPISDDFKFLPGLERITLTTDALADPTIDLVVCFDCANGDHVLEFLRQMSPRPFLISFDHHVTNPHYGDLNLILVEASSTAEVVWRFFKRVGIQPGRDSATCLLTGICTDTGIFGNPATNAVCLEAASELSLVGARVQDVLRHLFVNKSVGALQLWGRALERLRRHPDHNFVTTYITRADLAETQTTEEDLEGVSNFLIALLQTDTVMVFRETADGGVKGSMRTVSGNVAKIASWFPGGGGHIKAAGFTVPDVSLQHSVLS